ncbi:hypothetical protein CT0861_04460 [Colletotrichum tofieldiae]|uniref:Uncharacterized protein n=1 Tax=Colletotrichum tofieldiae TaxID=708197 RepID=A0A166Q7W2_9PEZI|nr:hypothetical protein CT0861_04460 [Colletotrichum tofieldiae]
MTDGEETDERNLMSKRMRGKNVKPVRLNKATTRRTTADCRPAVFRRYFKSLNAGRVHMPHRKSKTDIICGNIITTQPGSYKEPAFICRSAVDDSGVDIDDVPDGTKTSTVNMASHQTFGNFDHVTKAVRVLFGHGRGTFNWDSAKSLIAALGFEALKESGSGYAIAWTDKVRVPQTPRSKPSICPHAPRPHTAVA